MQFISENAKQKDLIRFLERSEKEFFVNKYNFQNPINMKPKHIVLITIPCQSAAEMLQAKEAVLFHLETLNPDFTTEGTTLTVKVIPLDPQLFLPDEACDIIRQTLAQSLTFNHCWTCTLQSIETLKP